MGRPLFAAGVLVLAAVAARAADDNAYKLIGRVTDEAGNPVAGAVVRVMTAPGLVSGDDRLRTGTSDERGNYAVAVPPGHAMCLGLEPPAGYIFINVGLLQFATSTSQPTHSLDLQLKRGRPLRLEFSDGLEDAESVSVWRHVPEFFMYDAPTTNPATTVTLPPDGGDITIMVPIESSGTQGRINLEMPDGFDPTRVEKITSDQRERRAEAVDAEGRKAVVRGATATEKDGQLTLHVKPLPFRLAVRNVRFTGRVVDASDRPISDAEIRFGHASANGAGSSSDVATTSGADGAFVLDAEVGTGTGKGAPYFFLIVTRDGTVGAVTKSKPIPANKETVEVAPIRLAKGHSLRVRVVDEAGHPLTGAWIQPGGVYLSAANFVKTDSEGRAVARNLPAGIARISARYGSLSYYGKVVVEAPRAGGEITLTLKPPGQAQAQAEPIPDPPPVGTPAPEWSIVGWTDGQTRKLADYRGKVVVLDFWGIWCSACMNALPASKDIEAKYADNPDVVFLGIHSAGTDMSQVEALQRVKDWPLVTGLDEGPDIVEGKTARAYGASGWPTVVVIDREGKIAYNSNLEKWNRVTVFLEMARVAKILDLPPPVAGASEEENIARSNAINVFRHSEQIDRALGEESP